MLSTATKAISDAFITNVSRDVAVEYMVLKMSMQTYYKIDGECRTLRDLQTKVYDRIWNAYRYSKKHGSPSDIQLFADRNRVETTEQLLGLKPDPRTKNIQLSLYIDHEKIRWEDRDV